jgi:hypothetical protein
MRDPTARPFFWASCGREVSCRAGKEFRLRNWFRVGLLFEWRGPVAVATVWEAPLPGRPLTASGLLPTAASACCGHNLTPQGASDG